MKNKVFAKSSKSRVEITNRQAQHIKKLYEELSQEISEEIEALSKRSNISSILRIDYLTGLQKQINNEIHMIGNKTNNIIKEGMSAVAAAVVADNQAFLGSIGLNISNAYSFIPKDIVNDIATGKLYSGRWTLNEAIWGNSKKTIRDINDVVAKGIIGQKSTYDIAKDLEKYVNPAMKKAWDWSKVYPGTARKVDYNAQRLARTMISHAYQDSIVRTTRDNPFVECYEWMTAGGDRVCEICQERESGFHGVVINGHAMHGCYYADDLPLDHPNGMCTIDVYIDKDYDAITDRLADWVNGEDDRELDRFAESLGYPVSTLRSKLS